MPASRRIFLSCVTKEFGECRALLANDLRLPNVDVKSQENFAVSGGTLLLKLDDYIKTCDAVVHLVGECVGACPRPNDVAELLARYSDLPLRFPDLATVLREQPTSISYTQWEAWLALYHRRACFVYVATESVPRGADAVVDDAGKACQQAHYARIVALGQDRGQFTSKEDLRIQVLRSLHDLLPPPTRKPVNLPYVSLGTLFRGRDSMLETLRQQLLDAAVPAGTGQAARVLRGLGGIGKTRLAVEFAWRHQEAFSALLFVTADSPTGLQENLAALTGPLVLDLRLKEDETREVRVAAALRWLAEHPNWFLIVDNIDTEEAAQAVEQMLAQMHGGRVLLTSRITNWSPMVEPLDLDVLTDEDASAFLLARTEAKRIKTPDDVAHAKALAHELDGLALALEQAGAYVSQRRMKLSDYRKGLQQKSGTLLSWFDQRLMAYPRSVAITYQESFERLTTVAQELLQLLAWCGPEPIPLALLQTDDEGVEQRMEGFAALDGFSLVKLNADGSFFTVHRLVQEIARTRQCADANGTVPPALATTIALLERAWPRDAATEHAWTTWNQLQPHALAACERAQPFRAIPALAALLHALGAFGNSRADYAQAEALLRQALALDEANLGPAHPDIARDLATLAKLLKENSRIEEAEHAIRRALTLDEAHPENAANIARDLNELGEILFAAKRLQEREPLYRRALALRRAHFGELHPAVAESLNNLGSALQDLRQLGEAEALYRQALAIGQRVLPANDRELAIWTNNLASLLSETGRRTEAEAEYRKTIAILRAGNVPDHPILATALDNLAYCLERTNPKEALDARRQALDIRWRYFGPQHEASYTSALTVVRNLMQQKEYDTAIELLTQLLYVASRRSAVPDPNVRGLLNSLAKGFEALSDWHRAERVYRLGLQFFPNDIMYLGNLGLLLVESKQEDAAARELLERAVAHDPQDAINRTTLAAIAMVMGDFATAQAELGRAWDIARSSLDEYAGRTLFLRAILASIRGEDNALFLGQLKQRWQIQPREAPWLADVLFERLRARCSTADHLLVTTLYAALKDQTQRAALNQIPRWQEVPPVDPTTAWPT